MELLRTGEPILRKYLGYIVICVFSFLTLIGLYVALENKEHQYSQQEANEQVKNTISLFIQKRILTIQNQFQYMMLTSSRAELDLANRTVSENIEQVKKALTVLERGGEFKETFFVNFGNQENLDQTLTYRAPDSSEISLSAIELKTNLIRLEDSRLDYLLKVTSRIKETDADKRREKVEDLALFHKSISPFFQRIIENSNRLYFESLNALEMARDAHLSQTRLYNLIGGGIAFMALGAILMFGFLINRAIMVILDERESAQNELVTTNENLETEVLKRTDSLQAEVAERRRTEKEMTRQAEFLTTVIESLNHPFYVIDIENHEIVIANEAARGGQDKSIKTCYQLTHHQNSPCSGSEHPCPIDLIRQTKAPVVTEHIHYDRLGIPRNVEVYGYPIFDKSGNIIQIIEYSLDITDKKTAQMALKKSRDELEETVIRRTKTLEEEIEKRQQYQSELEQREQHFQKLIQNINDIIIIIGETGRIEFISPSVRNILGWDQEDLIGRQVFDFVHPNEFEDGGPRLDTFLNFAQNTDQAEHRIRHQNGEYRIMESSLRFMVHDPDIQGIILTSRDITDRKENEEMQKKLLLAVEQNPNTVVITDTEGAIEYVNPSFEVHSGYSRDEVIGQNPRILNSGEVDTAIFTEMWDTLHSGNIWKGEFINRKKSGDLYTENVLMVPLKDSSGEVTHFVSIKENITELIKAREQAEAATRAKSEFLANMSHEIRTPMNAIIGMSHLTLATDLSPKQQEFIRKIHISANSLLELINSLLDFSKIEAQRLVLEQTEFSILTPINQVRDMISIQGHENNKVQIIIDLGLDIPQQLVGDPLRLKQILLNLCSNAAKFTHEGEILLQVNLVSRSDDSALIRFSVQDSGIGITEKQMENLFQAFSQADASTTRQYGGTGLGLTICKRLIQLMGGEIQVESTPGKGSRFWFDIPMQTTGSPPLRTQWPDLSQKRVLLVEGNEAAGRAHASLLSTLNAKVDTVLTGEKATRAFATAQSNDPYDLIILDQDLPDMSGLELGLNLDSFKRDEDRIILMTDLANPIMENNISELEQLSGVLSKPVRPDQLLDLSTNQGTPSLEKIPRTKSSEVSPDWLEPIRGAKLLLVEDNEINQDFAQELLQKAGFFVTIAENGQVAVEEIHNNRDSLYDAVLMDIQMPVMDGYQATREIRKHFTNEELPIIAMSASTLKEDMDAAAASGMNDYISKPIDITQLFQALTKWVSAGDRELPHDFTLECELKNDIESEKGAPIRMSEGLARACGNEELYQRILLRFEQDRRNTVQALAQLVENDDVDEAMQVIHQIKGEAGNIGAMALFESCKVLEACISDSGDYQQSLTTFNNNMNELLQFLAQMSSEPEQSSPIPAKNNDSTLPDELAEELKSLMPLVSQGNLSKGKKIINDIQAKEWPESFAKEITDLEYLIGRYRFPEALEKIQSILAQREQEGITA